MPELLSALNDPSSPFHSSDKAAWNPIPQESAASKLNSERDIPRSRSGPHADGRRVAMPRRRGPPTADRRTVPGDDAGPLMAPSGHDPAGQC